MADDTTKSAKAALPAAIRVGMYYSGFSDTGEYFAFNAGDLVTDPAYIAYFTGRDGVIYETVEG